MSEDTTTSTSSTSDAMLEDATPAAKPEGSPDLWPFYKLPRRKRADFMRAFGKVETGAGEVERPKPKRGSKGQEASVSLGQAADMYDLLADLQDALRHAAVDVDAFDEWAAGCEDNDISALSTWYMNRFQVGEAQASST